MACENAFRCTILANVPSTLEDQRTRNTRKTVKTSYVNWDCSRWVKHCQPAHWKAVKTQFVHSCDGNDAVFFSLINVCCHKIRPSALTLSYLLAVYQKNGHAWELFFWVIPFTNAAHLSQKLCEVTFPTQLIFQCLCTKHQRSQSFFINSCTIFRLFFFVCFGLILTGNADIAIRPRQAAWSVKGSQAGIHFKHFY